MQQLEDLFTTIDIMDATIEGLTAEMESGHIEFCSCRAWNRYRRQALAPAKAYI